MKPNEIDLFIDRLCGAFPTATIARNTVKNTWSKDEFMLGVDTSHGKTALVKLENDKTFPTLARVREVFRQLAHVDRVEGPRCERCAGSGWDDGMRVTGSDDFGWAVTQDPYTARHPLTGVPFNYVKQCVCVGGRHEQN